MKGRSFILRLQSLRSACLFHSGIQDHTFVTRTSLPIFPRDLDQSLPSPAMASICQEATEPRYSAIKSTGWEKRGKMYMQMLPRNPSS